VSSKKIVTADSVPGAVVEVVVGEAGVVVVVGVPGSSVVVGPAGTVVSVTASVVGTVKEPPDPALPPPHAASKVRINPKAA